MSADIPPKYLDLFSKPAFGHLATVLPDGSPQVTPVWCELEGSKVTFNSAKGRVKDRNIRRDPRVAITLQDPQNPYRYVEVRGRVVEITEQGAVAQIHRLSKKYLGLDQYPYARPGEVRVTYRIEPEKVFGIG